jgi:hypothetical protein
MKTELLEFLIESLGYTDQDASETIENGDAYILEESDLYDYIAEVLQLDSMPVTIQRYFDYTSFIRDMTYNGELYELKTWPKNSYVMIHS